MRMAFLSIHSSPLGKAGGKNTGGMSTYLRGLSEALGAAGYKVDLFTRAVGTGDEGISQLSENVRLIAPDDGNGPLAKGDIYPYCPEFAAAVDQFRLRDRSRYDIIFSHYWLSGCVGRVLEAKWQVPHLIMFHTLGRAKNEACSGENEPYLRIAEEEKLARSCSLVVAAAQQEKDKILAYFKLSPEKVAVIPCGVDRNLFRPRGRQRAKEQLGLAGRSVIFAVGRIEPVKGFDLLIEAAGLLPEEEDFRVIIAGGGDQSRPCIAALKKTAATLGIAGRVDFRGIIEHRDLPLYYSAADVTVIPSHYESFGLVALESIACGTPAVGAPVGILPELINRSGGRYGYLVYDRDPVSWAAKIREVLLYPEPISKSGIDKLLAPYNWADAASSLTGLVVKLKP